MSGVLVCRTFPESREYSTSTIEIGFIADGPPEGRRSSTKVARTEAASRRTASTSRTPRRRAARCSAAKRLRMTWGASPIMAIGTSSPSPSSKRSAYAVLDGIENIEYVENGTFSRTPRTTLSASTTQKTAMLGARSAATSDAAPTDAKTTIRRLWDRFSSSPARRPAVSQPINATTKGTATAATRRTMSRSTELTGPRRVSAPVAGHRSTPVGPGERYARLGQVEQGAEGLPAGESGQVDLQEVGSAGEVLPCARDVLVPLPSPGVLVDDQEVAVVLAGRVADDVSLHMAAAAVDPVVDRANGEDEAAARVLAVEHVEVLGQRLDVGERVDGGVEVRQERSTLGERGLDGPPDVGTTPVEAREPE